MSGRAGACGRVASVCVCVTSGGVVVWLGMFGVAVLCWRGVAWRGVARFDGCRAVCVCMGWFNVTVCWIGSVTSGVGGAVYVWLVC